MTTKISLMSAAIGALFLASVTLAQEETVTFPIPELGDCTSKTACKAYCDNPDHADACLSFAETHNLMPVEELAQARRFLEKEGPGGCRGLQCRAYCEDPAHRDECIAFAREQGLTIPEPPRPDIDEPEIDEERAMQIIETLGGPGGCKTMEECHRYCNVESNMDICLAFAEEHNLMSPADLARARAMMVREGPGGCRGLQCRAYCENPEHAEECLRFAEEQGFMSGAEVEKARKLMNAVGPGGCRGIECKAYCENPARQRECLEFAVENGFISESDAARMRAFMEGKGPGEFGAPSGAFEGFEGPGGCSSAEECRAYCEDPAHSEECLSFARERGFGEGPGAQNMRGPGGCSSPEECRAYCESHPGECGGGPDHPVGQERAIEMRGFEIPPGAPCSSPEECRALGERCKADPESCREIFGAPRQGEFQPPPGFGPANMPPGQPPPGDVYRQQYEQQFREEYQRQYQEQYREQYQQQSPPYQNQTSGEYHPPEGETYQPPPDGGTFQQPPPPPPADAPQANAASRFVASILYIVASLFQIQ